MPDLNESNQISYMLDNAVGLIMSKVFPTEMPADYKKELTGKVEQRLLEFNTDLLETINIMAPGLTKELLLDNLPTRLQELLRDELKRLESPSTSVGTLALSSREALASTISSSSTEGAHRRFNMLDLHTMLKGKTLFACITDNFSSALWKLALSKGLLLTEHDRLLNQVNQLQHAKFIAGEEQLTAFTSGHLGKLIELKSSCNQLTEDEALAIEELKKTSQQLLIETKKLVECKMKSRSLDHTLEYLANMQCFTQEITALRNKYQGTRNHLKQISLSTHVVQYLDDECKIFELTFTKFLYRFIDERLITFARKLREAYADYLKKSYYGHTASTLVLMKEISNLKNMANTVNSVKGDIEHIYFLNGIMTPSYAAMMNIEFLQKSLEFRIEENYNKLTIKRALSLCENLLVSSSLPEDFKAIIEGIKSNYSTEVSVLQVSLNVSQEDTEHWQQLEFSDLDCQLKDHLREIDSLVPSTQLGQNEDTETVETLKEGIEDIYQEWRQTSGGFTKLLKMLVVLNCYEEIVETCQCFYDLLKASAQSNRLEYDDEKKHDLEMLNIILISIFDNEMRSWKTITKKDFVYYQFIIANFNVDLSAEHQIPSEILENKLYSVFRQWAKAREYFNKVYAPHANLGPYTNLESEAPTFTLKP